MREIKSFLEQLSDCNEVITGKPLPLEKFAKGAYKKYKEKNQESSAIELDRTKSTHELLPGYEGRKVCGITRATLPIGYKLETGRLDAPCEECINRQCPFSMGKINIDNKVKVDY